MHRQKVCIQRTGTSMTCEQWSPGSSNQETARFQAIETAWLSAIYSPATIVRSRGLALRKGSNQWWMRVGTTGEGMMKIVIVKVVVMC